MSNGINISTSNVPEMCCLLVMELIGAALKVIQNTYSISTIRLSPCCGASCIPAMFSIFTRAGINHSSAAPSAQRSCIMLRLSITGQMK